MKLKLFEATFRETETGDPVILGIWVANLKAAREAAECYRRESTVPITLVNVARRMD